MKHPEFPGGKTAFKAYVKENLVYPTEALNKGVSGVVHLSARIDDNGRVDDVSVEKGIGSGCDEEAVRLVKNIQFGAVRNKGVRIKTRQRFRIDFRLPVKHRSIQYQYKKSSDKPLAESSKKQKNNYTYQINVGNI